MSKTANQQTNNQQRNQPQEAAALAQPPLNDAAPVDPALAVVEERQMPPVISQKTLPINTVVAQLQPEAGNLPVVDSMMPSQGGHSTVRLRRQMLTSDPFTHTYTFSTAVEDDNLAFNDADVHGAVSNGYVKVFGLKNLGDGDWEFKFQLLNDTNKVQMLREGKTVYGAFELEGGKSPISVTVPVLGADETLTVGAFSNPVVEDGVSTATIDVFRANDAVALDTTEQIGTYGRLSWTQDAKNALHHIGTYTLDNASEQVQRLSETGSVSAQEESFVVQLITGEAKTSVAPTIRGSDETITVVTEPNPVWEDGQVISASHMLEKQLQFSNLRIQLSSPWAELEQTEIAGLYGKLELIKDVKHLGFYDGIYILDNEKAQVLNANQCEEDTLTLKIKGEESAKPIIVKVHGQDEGFGPKADQQVCGEVSEDGVKVFSQVIELSSKQTSFSFTDLVRDGEYGRLELSPLAGSETQWTVTYTLDNAQAKVQNLTSADHKQEVFYFELQGAKGAGQIIIDVNGADERITGELVGQVRESGYAEVNPTVSKVLNVSSPTHMFTNDGKFAGEFGSLQLTKGPAQGDETSWTWEYTLNNLHPTVVALVPKSPVLTDTVHVTLDDGTQQQIQVSIKGNHAVITEIVTDTLQEDVGRVVAPLPVHDEAQLTPRMSREAEVATTPAPVIPKLQDVLSEQPAPTQAVQADASSNDVLGEHSFAWSGYLENLLVAPLSAF